MSKHSDNVFTRYPDGRIFLPGVGMCDPIPRGEEAAEAFRQRYEDPEEQKRRDILWQLRSFRVAEGLDAYRLGDRLGAPWEGSGPVWTPTTYEEIAKRANESPQGTDESDIVDCFLAFTEQYRFNGNLDDLLVSWVRFHAGHHRATSYGRTWKDYFRTVRYLDRKGELTVETLYTLARDRNRQGSAGNGCLALALPVYDYAAKLELRPTSWDGWVYRGRTTGGRYIEAVDQIGWVKDRTDLVLAFCRLSHAGAEALAGMRFLCFLFDSIRGIEAGEAEIDPHIQGCRPLLDYYWRTTTRSGSTRQPAGWTLGPEDFARAFPCNVLVGGTVVHALYALHTADDEEDLVRKVISMRGDTDSVLALALMLWRLIFPVSKSEVALYVTSSNNGPGAQWERPGHWRNLYF